MKNGQAVGRPLLLVVEDDEVDKELIRRLIPDKYEVVECSTGQSGVETLESRLPECVLLDYRLPDADGLEVLDSLLARAEYLPVVMLTRSGNEVVAVQALKKGAQDYVIKDQLTSHSLERTIENARLKMRLRASLRDQGEEFRNFAYSAAHDLRAPLRRLRSWSTILREKHTSPERSDEETQILARMEASVTELGTLIDGLLSYGQAGGAKLKAGKTDLAPVVQQALRNLEVIIHERRAIVEVGDLPNVRGDAAALVVLFQNLIGNALKYHDGTPHVRVFARQTDSTVVATVQDDGIGIDPQYADRIFLAFERLHGRSRYGGSGLGLATCKRIVNAHNGSIWVDSRPGEGSAFHVELAQAEPVHAPE